MTTAQLQLPFNQADKIPMGHSNKSHEKIPSIDASVGVTIRELTTAEQDDEILRLGKMFVDEVDLKEEIDEYTLRVSCIRCRADLERRNLNCFIAYLGDTAIGFLVGVAAPCFHRQGVVAEQKLWYVEQSRRGSMAARKLLNAYERWATLQGATQIFTGVANSRNAERTSKLLSKLGHARVGSIHVKEI